MCWFEQDGLHSLKHLRTWSLAGDAVWEGLGVVLLPEMHVTAVDFEVSNTMRHFHCTLPALFAVGDVGS